ncbi:hypothetical protein VTO73DRAFT_9753 [Trametes versicolor]
MLRELLWLRGKNALDTDHLHLNAEAAQAIPPVICLCLMIVDQHHLAIASHSALPNRAGLRRVRRRSSIVGSSRKRMSLAKDVAVFSGSNLFALQTGGSRGLWSKPS